MNCLHDKGREYWTLANHVDAIAALGLDEDNRPEVWIGVFPHCMEHSVAAKIEARGLTPCMIPIRINFPNVFCDQSPYRLSATADVELTQATLSIADLSQTSQTQRRRCQRLEAKKTPAMAAAKGGER